MERLNTIKYGGNGREMKGENAGTRPVDHCLAEGLVCVHEYTRTGICNNKIQTATSLCGLCVLTFLSATDLDTHALDGPSLLNSWNRVWQKFEYVDLFTCSRSRVIADI